MSEPAELCDSCHAERAEVREAYAFLCRECAEWMLSDDSRLILGGELVRRRQAEYVAACDEARALDAALS